MATVNSEIFILELNEKGLMMMTFLFLDEL